ncbi:Uncharacterised protein [Achromobacter sp. 2789STDY5608621]|nr:Uncharacterised protein [Achromobacter sp. 2789STDY5608621]
MALPGDAGAAVERPVVVQLLAQCEVWAGLFVVRVIIRVGDRAGQRGRASVHRDRERACRQAALRILQAQFDARRTVVPRGRGSKVGFTQPPVPRGIAVRPGGRKNQAVLQAGVVGRGAGDIHRHSRAAPGSGLRADFPDGLGLRALQHDVDHAAVGDIAHRRRVNALEHFHPFHADGGDTEAELWRDAVQQKARAVAAHVVGVVVKAVELRVVADARHVAQQIEERLGLLVFDDLPGQYVDGLGDLFDRRVGSGGQSACRRGIAFVRRNALDLHRTQRGSPRNAVLCRCGSPQYIAGLSQCRRGQAGTAQQFRERRIDGVGAGQARAVLVPYQRGIVGQGEIGGIGESIQRGRQRPGGNGKDRRPRDGRSRLGVTDGWQGTGCRQETGEQDQPQR